MPQKADMPVGWLFVARHISPVHDRYSIEDYRNQIFLSTYFLFIPLPHWLDGCSLGMAVN